MSKKVKNQKLLAVASASVLSMTLIAPNAFAEETGTTTDVPTVLDDTIGVNPSNSTESQNPLENIGLVAKPVAGVVKVSAIAKSSKQPLAGVKFGLFLKTGTEMVDDKTATPNADGKYPQKEVPTYIQTASVKTVDNGTAYFTINDTQDYQVRILSAPSYIEFENTEPKDVKIESETVSNEPINFNGEFTTKTISDDDAKNMEYLYDVTAEEKPSSTLSSMTYNVFKYPNPVLSTTSIDFGADATIANQLVLSVNGEETKLSALDSRLAELKSAYDKLNENKEADSTPKASTLASPDDASTPTDLSKVTVSIKNPLEGHSYILSSTPLDSKNKYKTTIDLAKPVSFSVLVGYDAPYGLSGKFVKAPTFNSNGELIVEALPVIDPEEGSTAFGVQDDSFVSTDGKLIPLTGEAEALIKRISSEAKDVSKGLSSAEYKTLMDSLASDLQRMQNVYRVTYPFTSVELLNSVYPYGLSSSEYGYAPELDSDSDKVSGETADTTDKNLNKSVYELLYDQALKIEAGAKLKASELTDKVKVNTTKEDYLKERDALGLIPTKEYDIGTTDKALLYKMSDGYVYVYVSTDTDKVTEVKTFQTTVEAKEYADSLKKASETKPDESKPGESTGTTPNDGDTTNNKEVVLADFTKVVTEGMKLEDFTTQTKTLKVVPNETATIEDGVFGYVYELKDAVAVVVHDGKTTKSVKNFTTLALAQEYVKSLQDEAKKVTVAKVKNKITDGMILEDYLAQIKAFALESTAEYPVGLEENAQVFKVEDGYVLIANNGKKVTNVKDFVTLDEAKSFAEKSLADSKKITVASFKGYVENGDTKAEADAIIAKMGINAVGEYVIGGEDKTTVYQVEDGYVSVGVVNDKVKFVEGFATLEEAKNDASVRNTKYEADKAEEDQKDADKADDNRGVSIADFKAKIVKDMTFEKYLLARDELGLTPVVNYSIGQGNVAVQYNLNDGFVLVGVDGEKVLFVESFAKEKDAKAYADSLYGDSIGDADAEAPIVADVNDATDGTPTDEKETDSNTDKPDDGATDTDKDADMADTDGKTTDAEGTDGDTADETDLHDDDAEGTLGSTSNDSTGGGSSNNGSGGTYSGSGGSSEPMTKTAILSKYLPQTGATKNVWTSVFAIMMAISGIALFKFRKKKDEESLNDLLKRM